MVSDNRRTRVLIVDDSVAMRSFLRTLIAADPNLEVAGVAADGGSALNEIESLAPDLILLDVEMPIMDGLVTLKNLRARGHKMPVIMCSSLTQRGAQVTIEALAAGASDYVAKPAGQGDPQAAMHALSQELLPRIHALTQRAPSLSAGAQRSASLSRAYGVARTAAHGDAPEVLAIAVSTGGPAALEALLPGLPADFPLPVLIVQHMPELFTRSLAERLDSSSRLPVREAAEGDEVRVGTVYIAKGNWHMEVLPPLRLGCHATLHLDQGPLENHCRPSADVLFRSVASVYGGRVLAVVLTGMGSDGMLGCRTIRDCGGSVIAQDQASSTVWGMPGAVVNAGLANRVVALAAMPMEIIRLARRAGPEVREMRRRLV